jgi:hypothetical protein
VNYAFEQGPVQALTPSLTMGVSGLWMVFRVTAAGRLRPWRSVVFRMLNSAFSVRRECSNEQFLTA